MECDLVIFSIGVRPENEIAKEAGLELGNRGGIKVDATMRTSDPDIFAVGDAVEVRDIVSGLPTMTALAGPANKQGRIAADNARFSFPEPQLGLIPAAGGTQRLAQVVGKARAKELILGGRGWEAEEALRFGLLSEVTDPEELLPRAKEWVQRIADRSPVALQLAKKAIDLDSEAGPGHSFERVAEALLYQLRQGGEKR